MLNHKQQLFILEYQRTLNATQAAINAGYSERTAYSIGNRLLKKEEKRDNLIADVTTIQQFWTETMKDSECDMKHRLRASELLAKSLGLFVEQSKVEVQQVTTLADLMLEAYNS